MHVRRIEVVAVVVAAAAAALHLALFVGEMTDEIANRGAFQFALIILIGSGGSLGVPLHPMIYYHGQQFRFRLLPRGGIRAGSGIHAFRLGGIRRVSRNSQQLTFDRKCK